MSASIKSNPLGYTGLFIGIIALGLAAIPPFVIEPKPEKLTDTAIEEGLKLARKLLKKKPPPPPPKDSGAQLLHIFRYTSVGVGLLAAVLGLIGWIRKENKRVTFAAIGVGGIAALWIYVIAALVVALIIAIIIAFFSD